MGGLDVLVVLGKVVLLTVNAVMVGVQFPVHQFLNFVSADGGPKKKVVILGASFSGTWSQRNLSQHCDVTVVDFKDYFEYTPGVLRAFTDPSYLGEITCAIPQSSNRFVHGLVTAVDDEKVTVTLASKDNAGEIIHLPYDYLLVGTGSTYQEPIKPTPAEAFLEQRIKTWEKASAQLAQSPSVLIIGGGPVGVELAGEIVQAYPDKKVTIVDFAATVCAPFPKDSIDYITKWLKSKGVELILGTGIAGKFPDLLIDEKGCTLTDGRRIDADIVYKCMGFRANAGFMKASFPNSLDRGGRLVVDDTLRLEGHPKIFAMGDCMIHSKSGEIKLGHTAEINAHLVVDNILRLEKGQAPLTYPDGVTGPLGTPKIYNISLGKYAATVGFNRLVMSGSVPAFAKWLLEWTKVQAVDEKPIGVFFWKLADHMSLILGKTVLTPAPKAKL